MSIYRTTRLKRIAIMEWLVDMDSVCHIDEIANAIETGRCTISTICNQLAREHKIMKFENGWFSHSGYQLSKTSTLGIPIPRIYDYSDLIKRGRI